SESDVVDITYPAGYELESPETPGALADPQKIGLLDIRIGVDKASPFVQYRREFHFGGSGAVFFASKVYQPLKNLFDAFSKMDDHTLSLKQK
ncbi:MAG: hypothetical protein ACRD43_01320, partial [Pyrinomonadaceae bacterium]